MFKLIGFDMDGVIFDTSGYEENNRRIATSSWNILFHELGIYDEHERLKQLYINGVFPSYMEWTNEACRVLQYHLTKEKYLDFVNRRPFTKGAVETAFALKENNYKLALISGSFQELADRAKSTLNLDYPIAHCKLIFDKNGKLKNGN